ncbi:MAG: protein phosphatase 2C domain-containing protein, partial [Cyanobacteria bacterium P01_A01_bin.135]
SYYIDPAGRFCIVADGMGGHAGGEEASRLAVSAIRDCLGEHWTSETPSPKLLELAIDSANEAILTDQQHYPSRADMGTTVLAVVFRDDGVWCAHVGDSRLYQFRDRQLKAVTEDHTWVARAIRLGELSREDARLHPWRHILSHCLGREDLDQIDLTPLTLQVGDRLLLCSDGLTEELPDDTISAHLATSSGRQTATLLVEAAKEQGGRDNVTVVVVDYQGDAKRDSGAT